MMGKKSTCGSALKRTRLSIGPASVFTSVSLV
jgi:hypothetical protein